MTPHRWPHTLVLFLLLLAILAPAASALADDHHGESAVALPATPDDARLDPLTTLNDYFPFQPATSPEAWQTRANELRRQLLVATGLWPMPTKTPDNAVVHGRVEREGYSVERVYFESFPGHFVTGSLYRPTGRTGKLPGVLCPHGHWADGRFYDAGPEAVKKQIADGAERFDPSGRYPLQARCVQLARMGCVVFHYDMVGYADSQQLAHRAGVRPAMNAAKDWGYFSPQAEARLQTVMGLQTYNSVRALDWFTSLPDVDPARIGVTGASGGGTQTFILAAIDPRPAVAFPAVMVSTAMQGGCTCENCSYLRVGTGNVEIAALFAPKPLGMTAADDWTKEMETKGFPELKQHYAMLGAPENVMLAPFLQFPHNYNYVSRAAMYPWMNKHLQLGATEPIVETDFQPLTREELTVWDGDHPRPPHGDDYERSLLAWITADNQKQMEALRPRDAESLARFRETVGGAVEVMIGRTLADYDSVEAADRRDEPRAGHTRVTLTLKNPAGEAVPALMLVPEQPKGTAVIWIDRHHGKAALEGAHGEPRPAVAKLLAAGVTVLGLDLLGQGDFTPDGKPLAHQPLSEDAHTAYAGYTFGYNHPLFSKRVHDILTAVAWLRQDGKSPKIALVGLNGAGHWVAAARAVAGDAVARAVVDTAGFRFANLTAIDDPDFLPGGAKYLDLPGFLALSAPHPLYLAGETEDSANLITAAYQAAGHPEALKLSDKQAADAEQAAIAWLLH